MLYYLRPAFSFVYVKGKSHHFDVWIMCLFHDLVLHCFLFHSVGQGAIIKIIIPTHDKLMEIEHLINLMVKLPAILVSRFKLDFQK